ncbi:MAG: DNA recombination protein RmuC [Rhodobacteraceae bacterium]|nr:DNA recombination protein RmuC [Paracoccaceae bacterium]MAY47975.1 DNA recombination protein RmuC [Paracoccaceae bacterium]
MIQIGGQSVATDDPRLWIAAGVAGAVLLLLMLLIASIRASGRAARAAEPMAAQMAWVSQSLQQMAQGQDQLRGGLQHVSDTQANGQMQLIQRMESRLANVQQQMSDRLAENTLKSQVALAEMQERMTDTLHGQSKATTTSLTQLQERLKVIDKAQDNITRLSGDVLSLQDILSNKQTRGAFGEIQLHDIVAKALPADSYAMQVTLSNGRRADCLIRLPNPPGPIVIDSKFPLEAWEALRKADNDTTQARAQAAFRQAVRVHIKAIAEKYILEGETAEGALMFLPSEAVYAELHASFPEVVREGFDARVWIVSPTTCMATLNTMRAILKDARMREQAGAIRTELALLNRDVGRLGERVANLDRHFSQAARDVAEIRVSAEKAGRRAERLDRFDFDEAPQAVPHPVTVPQADG